MFDVNKAKSFLKSEDGAVTVDWVVLTAAIVGLAVAGMLATRDGVMTASSTISNALETFEP